MIILVGVSYMRSKNDFLLFFCCTFTYFFRLKIGYLNMNWKKKLSEVKIHGVQSFFVQTNSFENERIAIIDRNVNFVG